MNGMFFLFNGISWDYSYDFLWDMNMESMGLSMDFYGICFDLIGFSWNDGMSRDFFGFSIMSFFHRIQWDLGVSFVDSMKGTERDFMGFDDLYGI